ncbi:MAG: TetR/AcrR family transcriptional regulator [Chloroflexi bacterium]|nr:TetR/AcrR family transcriptional regulator [Chloroflexota bacterium]
MSETNTRARIMDLAQDLLREKGYTGFSYTPIAGALGVRNAAIHYHFPTKENLGEALVERERRRFLKWTGLKAIRDLDAWGKLDWFCSIYERYSQGGTRVCYLGALESSFDALPEAVQSQAQRLNLEMLAWLEEVLEAGRQAGDFRYEGRAAGRAVLIMSALQGAVQIARVTAPDNLEQAIQQIRASLR